MCHPRGALSRTKGTFPFAIPGEITGMWSRGLGRRAAEMGRDAGTLQNPVFAGFPFTNVKTCGPPTSKAIAVPAPPTNSSASPSPSKSPAEARDKPSFTPAALPQNWTSGTRSTIDGVVHPTIAQDGAIPWAPK
jgi:hypothetical protein